MEQNRAAANTGEKEEFVFVSDAPEKTERLGEVVGKVAEPGTILVLEGPLGAGKTVFVRGVARGLRVPDPDVVTSPTFVLLQEYVGGRLPLYHFDCYRLRSPEEFVDLGVEDLLREGVCAIEWGERVISALPGDLVVLSFHYKDPQTREIHIQATGQRSHELLRRLCNELG